MSLRAVDAAAGMDVDVELHPKAEGFQRQWVYVDAAVFSPVLQAPMTPAKPSSGWEHTELVDPWLVRVMARLADLRKVSVTMAMVVREFVQRSIAPLERHSHPMWAFIGPTDDMRLQQPPLPSSTLPVVLRLLTGEEAVGLPLDGLPL